MRIPNFFGLMTAAAALALAGCGGGGGGGSSTGTLNLSVADGPVEEADHVWVEFSSVTLKPADGEAFTIPIDPAQRVDLLDQDNGKSELLLQNQSIPAGDYAWIRLGVEEGPGKTEIVFPGPTAHVLDVPRNGDSLQLVSGFNVSDGEFVSLTIHFDLRKSVVEAPPGSDQYKLRPALRLVRDEETGEIAATATTQYVTDNNCGSNDGGGGEPIQSVFVYQGDDVTPDDLNTTDDGDVDPYGSAILADDDTDGIYTGTVGHLPAGDYTVAFVCDAEDDVAQTDENLSFLDIRTVEVEAGETSNYDLP